MADLIVDGLLKIYQDTDEKMHGSEVLKDSRCERGCHHCCYLFVACSFVEALAIARVVAKRLDWKWMVKRMRTAAKLLSDPKMSHPEYFRKRVPCPFLDERKGECLVYDVRPASCRYHYVISDPELCSPRNEAETMALDLMFCEHAAWEYSEQYAPPKMGTSPFGPVPLMVLFLLGKYTDHKKLKVIKQHMKGLPNPYEWMSMFAKDMQHMREEAMPRRRLSHEEAMAALKKQAS